MTGLFYLTNDDDVYVLPLLPRTSQPSLINLTRLALTMPTHHILSLTILNGIFSSRPHYFLLSFIFHSLRLAPELGLV